MRTLTTTEYNEVCKSYAQFGSKLFDEMFIGYDDNSVSYLYNEDYYEVKWGCRVFQKNFDWFVSYNNQTQSFFDGMILIDANHLEVA